MKGFRWCESTKGSGIFVLGPLDGPSVRYSASDGGVLVWGFMGPQIDIWVRSERIARRAGRRAYCIEWPRLQRKRRAIEVEPRTDTEVARG